MKILIIEKLIMKESDSTNKSYLFGDYDIIIANGECIKNRFEQENLTEIKIIEEIEQ